MLRRRRHPTPVPTDVASDASAAIPAGVDPDFTVEQFLHDLVVGSNTPPASVPPPALAGGAPTSRAARRAARRHAARARRHTCLCGHAAVVHRHYSSREHCGSCPCPTLRPATRWRLFWLGVKTSHAVMDVDDELVDATCDGSCTDCMDKHW